MPAHRVPVGSQGILPDYGLGGSPLSSPAFLTPTSSPSSRGSKARVNVIGGGGDTVGITHPANQFALKTTKVPKFSGRSEDYVEWENQWTQFLGLLHGGGKSTLPNQTVLLTMKGYLDEASAADLQARMNQDAGLEYYAFLATLRDRYMRDVVVTHRQNWSRVKLHSAGKHPTLQEWRKFEADYRAKRALVEDWSDHEDYQLVFSQVPAALRKKVMTETYRRRAHKKWARVTAPGGMSLRVLLQQLELALGAPLNDVTMDRRHFVVHCANSEQLAHLISLDKARMDGQQISIVSTEYNMSGDEILAYVGSILLQDDEIRLLEQSYQLAPEAGTPRSPARSPQAGGVFAVVQESPTQTATQAGKGGRGSPNRGNRRNQGKGSQQQQPQQQQSPQQKDGNAAAPKPDRKPAECWECQNQGKPSNHYWYTCEVRRKASAERRQRQEAYLAAKEAAQAASKAAAEAKARLVTQTPAQQ